MNVDWKDAEQRGFNRAAFSHGTLYISPSGPTLLLSKYTSRDVPVLHWAFRVEGNSSWSVGLIVDNAKHKDDELFQRGKLGLDNVGLMGGEMRKADMHGKRVEVIYETSSHTATFKFDNKTIEQKGFTKATSGLRLALSTFNGCKIYMYTESSSSSIAVGSKVRVKASVLRPKYNWGAVSHSDLGTVVSIADDGDVLVNFPKQSKWKGTLDEMEVVAHDSASPNERNVKVGDMLRITSDVALAEAACEGQGGWVRSMQKHLGKLGTVKVVHSQCVRLEVNGDSWVWGWGAVRFDSDGGPQRPLSLKVGDKVKLAQGYKLCADAGEGPLTPRDVGVIIAINPLSMQFKVQTGKGLTWWYTQDALLPAIQLSSVHAESLRSELSDSASDSDAEEDGDKEDQDNECCKAIPSDWGARHIASVQVSSGGGANKLTDGLCSSYWQSDGQDGMHGILLELRRPAFLFELGIVVDARGSGESYCPERLRVLMGQNQSSLQDLGSQTHRVTVGKGPTYLRLAGASDSRVSLIAVMIEGSGPGSCGRNCRVVGVCVNCGSGRLVEGSNCAVGLRVVRGPDWNWGEQDGGEGRQGKVTEIDTEDEGWATVLWDAGKECNYRIGAQGAHDLAIVSDDDISSLPAKVENPHTENPSVQVRARPFEVIGTLHAPMSGMSEQYLTYQGSYLALSASAT